MSEDSIIGTNDDSMTLDEAMEIVALYVTPPCNTIEAPSFRQRVAIRKVLRSFNVYREEMKSWRGKVVAAMAKAEQA